jgi:aminoglycoside phosphotransferase family enzyme
VWKLKKPVLLHHLDLRSLAAREHFCREELRLNRELAGEVYRGVDPLVRRREGSLAIGGEGTVVDWLVQMDRLPSDQMLDRRLSAGPALQLPEIERVSRRMIDFYRGSRPEDAGAHYVERWIGMARTNAAHLGEMREVLGGKLDVRLPEKAIAMLETHREEIIDRGRRYMLIEGHGDLRPEHVCLGNPPVIFDRVEFDPGVRLVDPFEEFNYLGLECAMAGAAWIRAVLLISLSQAGIAPPSPALLAAYGVNRCLTRARLAVDHLRDPEVRTPEKWPAQARTYLIAAARLEKENGFPRP